MCARIFYPVSSLDADVSTSSGQRYRYPFNDLRLYRKWQELQGQINDHQTVTVNRLSEAQSELMSYYRFLNNDSVEVSELIYHSCRLPPDLVEARDVIVIMDTTSVALTSRFRDKDSGEYPLGVIEDNRTPGFFLRNFRCGR